MTDRRWCVGLVVFGLSLGCYGGDWLRAQALRGAVSGTIAPLQAAAMRPVAPVRLCRAGAVEFSARAGQSVRLRVTRELDVWLEARGGGWLLRVVPHGVPQPTEDYAEIATPPYRSVSPLLLSTDFGLRAQDAVGWNPRRFRFAADRRAYAAFEPVYRAIERTARPSRADETALGRLVAAAPEGTIEILDARLTPGTADKGRAAEGIVDRYDATPHTVVQVSGRPLSGEAAVLGQIVEVRLRVALALEGGSQAAPGVHTVATACTGASPR